MSRVSVESANAEMQEELKQECFELYKEVAKLGKANDDRILKFCLCGGQSSGKTSIIESYAGQRVGYVASSCATRCPVRYTMTKVASPEEEGCFLNKERKENLSDALRIHMQALAQNTDGPMRGFSEQILEVEVHSMAADNIIFLDLPGLRSAEVPDADVVLRLNAKFLRDRSYTPIIVSKLESEGELYAIGNINKVFDSEDICGDDVPVGRTDWRKTAIMVFNKVDEKIRTGPDPTRVTQTGETPFAEFVRTLAEAQSFQGVHPERCFFMALRPNMEGIDDVRDLHPQAWTDEHVKHTAALGDKWFHESRYGVANLYGFQTGKEEWNRAWAPRFGFGAFRKYMEGEWLDSLVTSLHKIQHWVESKQGELLRELQQKEADEQGRDKNKVRMLFMNYLQHFAQQMKCLYRGMHVDNRRQKHGPKFRRTRFDTEEMGKTYEQDISDVPRPLDISKRSFKMDIPYSEILASQSFLGVDNNPEGSNELEGWEGYLGMQELIDKFTYADAESTGLLPLGVEVAEERFVGQNQCRRIVDIVTFMILNQYSKKFTRDEIRNTSQNGLQLINESAVCLACAKSSLDRGKSGVRWMCLVGYKILQDFAPVVTENLLSSASFRMFQPSGPFHPFTVLVQRKYCEIVDAAWKTVEYGYHDDAEFAFAGCREDDLVQELMSVCVGPSIPEMFNLDLRPSAARNTKEVIIPGDDALNRLQAAADDSDEEAKQDAPSKHNRDVIEGLQTIASFAGRHRKAFTIAEYVGGGYGKPKPVVHVDMDMEYMNKMIRGFYFSMARKLVHLMRGRFRVEISALFDALDQASHEGVLLETLKSRLDEELTDDHYIE